MDFKFGRYIYSVSLNESVLKIFDEKRERGRVQGLRNFWIFGWGLLSHERVMGVKLRTSNFVRTLIGSIETKAHKKFRREK